ncbi:hypothetical protein ABIA69_002946 [Lysinibacillus parviboronicapiens]|uniref:Uncharacterized protein n=1 Tax=Lysinibacillus parviboronicapiens TaxID=436516 RepID=A0ABV2PLH5_9BACI
MSKNFLLSIIKGGADVKNGNNGFKKKYLQKNQS